MQIERFAFGWIPEWPKGTDCKSAATCFGGSNPPPSIMSRKRLITDMHTNFFEIWRMSNTILSVVKPFGSRTKVNHFVIHGYAHKFLRNLAHV